MNILIIGMGFAGTLYKDALSYLQQKNRAINIGYQSKSDKGLDIDYYPTIEVALKNHAPSLIILTVNDIFHFEVLEKLKNFEGTILCEKPLVANQIELNKVKQFFSSKTTLVLSTVIRFSLASQVLKNFLYNKNFSIKKINFTWKKNRFNDYRPTVGVISEIIHPLDTIQWLLNEKIKFHHISTTSSNYSIDRKTNTLDSAFVQGKIGESVISGYSSFVSLQVERTIEIVLYDPLQKTHYYILLTFDKFEWFSDKLIIFQEKNNEYKEIINFNSMDVKSDYDKKIERVLLMLENIINDRKSFSDLCLNNEAIKLQSLLNQLLEKATDIEVDYEFSTKDILKKDSTNFDRIG